MSFNCIHESNMVMFPVKHHSKMMMMWEMSTSNMYLIEYFVRADTISPYLLDLRMVVVLETLLELVVYVEQALLDMGVDWDDQIRH